MKTIRAIFRRLRKSESGQGMTEYIIIVALIAIAAITVVTMFGENIRNLFAGSANALAGQEQATISGQTVGDEQIKRSLSDFADHEAP